MNILKQLADSHLGDIGAVGASFGVSRTAAYKWFQEKRIPKKRWDQVPEILPHVTKADCYRQFGRRHRKPKTKTKSNIN